MSSQPAIEDSVFTAMESEVRLYCRRFPAVFDRACGASLYAEDGREFIDFLAGAGALNYGHNHPYIKRRLVDYLAGEGPVHGLDLHTTVKRDFLVRLRDVVLAPRGLDHRVQFSGPSGANAVEAALKVARMATGRTQVVAFAGAFHGMSQGALAVTGARGPRAAGGAPLQNVVFVPYEDGPDGGFDSIGYLDRMFRDEASGIDLPAAVIVETVQLDGGVFPASARWLRRLRELTRRFGVVLICDEIQTGCGRTGRFFGFERAGIVPDVITLSKSLSGIGLPLSIVLLRPELDVWRPGDHTSTFRGNELALVCATAALDLWESPDLHGAMTRSAERLRAFAGEIADLDPNIGVRWVGAVAGLDLRAAGGSPRAADVQRRCFEDGLILELCGRGDEVIKVLPPVLIDPVVLDRGLAVLRAAVAATR